MMIRSVPLILLFLLLGRSCFYTDLSNYEVEIQGEYVPQISFASNLSGKDSVLIGDSIFFRYEILLDSGEYFFTDLYFDNQIIFRSDSLVDSLWIKPYYFADPGESILTLACFLKSYSGSLADIMNAEFLVADSAWAIKVYSFSEK